MNLMMIHRSSQQPEIENKGMPLFRSQTFRKGIHPPEHKEFTNSKKIEYLALPDEVFIPLQQHIGAPAEASVVPGDEVKTGQLIGRSEKYVSSPVHASITGKVKAVGNFLHPLGARVQMVHISRAEAEEWDLLDIPEDWRTEAVEKLLQLIWDAGLVRE